MERLEGQLMVKLSDYLVKGKQDNAQVLFNSNQEKDSVISLKQLQILSVVTYLKILGF